MHFRTVTLVFTFASTFAHASTSLESTKAMIRSNINKRNTMSCPSTFSFENWTKLISVTLAEHFCVQRDDCNRHSSPLIRLLALCMLLPQARSRPSLRTALNNLHITFHVKVTQLVSTHEMLPLHYRKESHARTRHCRSRTP